MQQAPAFLATLLQDPAILFNLFGQTRYEKTSKVFAERNIVYLKVSIMPHICLIEEAWGFDGESFAKVNDLKLTEADLPKETAPLMSWDIIQGWRSLL